jgi:hypothetical protein
MALFIESNPICSKTTVLARNGYGCLPTSAENAVDSTYIEQKRGLICGSRRTATPPLSLGHWANFIVRLCSRQSVYAALVGAAFLLALATWWLKAAHTPAMAIQVAETFLEKMDAGQFEQAFELTVKHGYVGRTPDELKAISQSGRASCLSGQFAYTFPFQSNGNWLRRLVSGKEADMPEVHVEFVGHCLLSVILHKTPANTWRVSQFASHAG